MGPVKVEPCGYATELDLESLIWTRGAKYPCWRLASRLKCPRCGGTAVEVAWLPGGSPAVRAGRDLYQCVVASGLGQGFRYVRTITPAEGFAAWANKKGIRSKSNMPYICRTLSDQKPKYLLST
jgi:hypothetical protein